MLDSATAHLAQGLLQKLHEDESSCGLRDACEKLSQSLDRKRSPVKSRAEALLLRTGVSRSFQHSQAKVLHQQSGVPHFCDGQRTKAGICCCKLLLNSMYGLNESMLITKKVAAAAKFCQEILFCCWFQKDCDDSRTPKSHCAPTGKSGAEHTFCTLFAYFP